VFNLPQKLPTIGPLRLPDDRPDRALLRRVLLAVALILISTFIVWFDRGGLRDNVHPDEPPGFVDILYFNIVSLTTVGYGDITPESTGARLRNALVLTPIRIFLWVMFLGTAYELSIMRLRFREERKMRELRDRLRHHVIVCGYGSKGQAIVDELLAHDHPPEDIVIIEQNEIACDHAAKRGLVVLHGDGTQEEILEAARIDDSAYVLVATDRDDAATLICLTVRSLNKQVHIVAAARQEENIKLLYQAGANLVIAPSVTGGRLMAAAVRQHAVPQVLQDLIMFGEGMSLTERNGTADEIGKPVSEAGVSPKELVISVKRAGHLIPFGKMEGEILQAEDVLVLLIDQSEAVPSN
jgi:voltage-gated potassium channel